MSWVFGALVAASGTPRWLPCFATRISLPHRDSQEAETPRGALHPYLNRRRSRFIHYRHHDNKLCPISSAMPLLFAKLVGTGNGTRTSDLAVGRAPVGRPGQQRAVLKVGEPTAAEREKAEELEVIGKEVAEAPPHLPLPTAPLRRPKWATERRSLTSWPSASWMTRPRKRRTSCWAAGDHGLQGSLGGAQAQGAPPGEVGGQGT